MYMSYMYYYHNYVFGVEEAVMCAKPCALLLFMDTEKRKAIYNRYTRLLMSGIAFH